MAEQAGAEAKTVKGNSPIKLVIVIIVGAIFLVAVSIGGVFFMMKSMGMLGGGGGGNSNGESQVEHSPALYFPLDPAFVVNFKENGRTRFLQCKIEVMTRDPQIVEDIKANMPVIRNNFIMLLGNQKAEDLETTAGKEKIRAELLDSLKKFLAEETGRVKVEGLYFTSFVTQ